MRLTLAAVHPDHVSAAAQAFYVLLSPVILKKSRKVLPQKAKKRSDHSLLHLFNTKHQSMFCRKAFVRSSFGCAKNSSGSPCSTIVPSAMKMT